MAEVCAAWRFYLKENWDLENTDNVPLHTNPDNSPQKQKRRELLQKWTHAPQEFRDEYIRRVSEEGLGQGSIDYLTDIPPDDLRRDLKRYPCIRVHFNDDDALAWKKLQCCLKLDEHLSPLDPEELPHIFEVEDNFCLQDFTRRYILEDANFELMGGSDFGGHVFYYYIIMIADEQSFRDGTLLHVDFNSSGSPDTSFRYPAIHSYLPWKWNYEQSLDLPMINERILHEHYRDGTVPPNGNAPSGALLPSMDLTRSIVDILVEEMESRGVSVEDTTYHDLATAAVTIVNEDLL